MLQILKDLEEVLLIKLHAVLRNLLIVIEYDNEGETYCNL